MGREVLACAGVPAGFTHMEWYRKDDGEVVFGEIGARPPGARTVDVMNYATDGDLFRMWAEAVVHGKAAPLERRYNAANIFKRAEGSGLHHPDRGTGPVAGRLRRPGLRGGPAADRCPPPRLAGHPDLRRHGHRPAPRTRSACSKMADRFGTELRMYAS